MTLRTTDSSSDNYSHMFNRYRSLLLYTYDHIWLTQDFPTSWKTAIIISVPKPGKVLSDPGIYRPIALTSCLCKTMERMVNSRLTWYLERHMVITEFQSGFRHISTVDNLVTLETSIRDAFVGRNHLVFIFFLFGEGLCYYLARFIQNRSPWSFTNVYL